RCRGDRRRRGPRPCPRRRSAPRAPPRSVARRRLRPRLTPPTTTAAAVPIRYGGRRHVTPGASALLLRLASRATTLLTVARHRAARLLRDSGVAVDRRRAVLQRHAALGAVETLRDELRSLLARRLLDVDVLAV